MKNLIAPLKTAPQILEHYFPYWSIHNWNTSKKNAIKAMRHYARIRIEKEREKIKDEMYEEAREIILEQYDL